MGQSRHSDKLALLADINPNEFNVANKLLKLNANAKVPESQDNSLLAQYNHNGLLLDYIFDNPDALDTTINGSAAMSFSGSGFIGIATGATINSYIYVWKKIGEPITITPTGKRSWKTRIYFGSESDQLIEIGTGNLFQLSEPGLRIKVLDNAFWGSIGNGSGETTLDLSATCSGGHSNVLELKYIPNTECRFFIDGVDKGAITTNLPNVVDLCDFCFGVSIKNLAASNKNVNMATVRYLSEP